jgi:hypothetical protein
MLFLIWANVDVNFVLGVFALLLFTAVQAIGPRIANPAADTSQPPINLVAAISAASLIATFITPYGWKPWGVFFARLTGAANDYLPGFGSLRFRSPQDYLLLLLMAAAALALGIRRSRDLFTLALLMLAAFASFHSQREAWLLTIVAVVVIADELPDADAQSGSASAVLPRSQFFVGLAAAVVLLIAAAIIHFPRSQQSAQARISKAYPVAAANYIREHQLPQPLFNTLPWGGFLEFYLPQYPVAIDGRTELYGDDFNLQYGRVMNAEAHFSTFPPFNQAATILLQKDSVMGKALPNVSGFKVAYSDDIAVVLLREQPTP